MGPAFNTGLKLFIFFAVVAALLVAAGCGGSSTATAASKPSPTPGPAPSPSPTPGPVPSPSPTPGPVPSPSPTPGPTSTGVPHSAHVVLVIEENHSFAQVLSGMPWLTSMGNQYAYAMDYHADEPGSLLDYLWLSSGSGEKVFGCSGAGC